jgi:DNA repair exonuclease SbcCD ATPase subunit
MTDLDTLTSRTQRRRRELDGLAGEARAVLTRGKEIQAEISDLTDYISDYERVTVLLNSLGEEKQLKAQTVIEDLVTRGLQTIFDSTLSFHIIQSVRGKTANVDFIVRTTLPESVIETSVMDARGGGLAATIGFLLRLVVMLLRGGTKEENILILDETFAHVSAEYLAPLGEFVREIVDKTNVQIVMVTHQPEFADYADKVYRFTTLDGKTQVQEDA